MSDSKTLIDRASTLLAERDLTEASIEAAVIRRDQTDVAISNLRRDLYQTESAKLSLQDNLEAFHTDLRKNGTEIEKLLLILQPARLSLDPVGIGLVDRLARIAAKKTDRTARGFNFQPFQVPAVVR